MSQRFQYKVTAKIFYNPSDCIEQPSYDQYNAYIINNEIHKVFAESLFAEFDTEGNKTVQSVTYDPDTRIMTTIVNITDDRWIKNDNRCDSLIAHIYYDSFEDGLYEGTSASYIDEHGLYLGDFDIRNIKTIDVEIVEP